MSRWLWPWPRSRQDVARAALDELASRGDTARPRITAALNSPLPDVRKYAFELLEKLSPAGSLEPLLAALSSEHADLRIGVIERLAGANDSRVTEALGRAMASEHEDLRLRASELLAWRKDDRAVEVLGTFLRSENAATAKRAMEALARLATPAAVASRWLAGCAPRRRWPERNEPGEGPGPHPPPGGRGRCWRGRCWRTRPPACAWPASPPPWRWRTGT